eukprot:SAG11_NODE_3022_length_2757_cov_1.220843_4_plen_95_part_00
MGIYLLYPVNPATTYAEFDLMPSCVEFDLMHPAIIVQGSCLAVFSMFKCRKLDHGAVLNLVPSPLASIEREGLTQGNRHTVPPSTTNIVAKYRY